VEVWVAASQVVLNLGLAAALPVCAVLWWSWARAADRLAEARLVQAELDRRRRRASAGRALARGPASSVRTEPPAATRAQLEEAVIDHETKLPSYLRDGAR
jgi:hypothetical protein